MDKKTVIKRHGKFKLSEVKRGMLFIEGKNMNFKIIKSLGKRYMVLQDEAISFSNFNELFSKLRERQVRLMIAYDKYGKSYATILL
jgi:hypothetical protein